MLSYFPTTNMTHTLIGISNDNRAVYDYDKLYEVIYTAVYQAVKMAWKEC